jgi:hypothetical protein
LAWLNLYWTYWPPPDHRHIFKRCALCQTITHLMLIRLTPITTMAIAYFNRYSLDLVLTALNLRNLYLINHTYLRNESGVIRCGSSFRSWQYKTLFLNMKNYWVNQLFFSFQPILHIDHSGLTPDHRNVFKRCAWC